MFYTVYKTTNIINGKYYIGAHQTNNLQDGYLGSGKVFRRAVTKYGEASFSKIILFHCVSADQMYAMERAVITQAVIDDKNSYNLRLGGEGGWEYARSRNTKMITPDIAIEYNQRATVRRKLLSKTDPVFEAKRISILKNMNAMDFDRRTFLGRNHSAESKRLIGEANKIAQSGHRNSHFGNCWIYNLDLKVNKSIPRNELEKYQKVGWMKGRKMKF
jgi:hypothetical protein